jgi:uncharacterized protein with von Willebrand factor type A (vWA) domain
VSGPTVLLRGVDRAAFAVAFASRLRRGGVPVGVTSVEAFVRALTAAPPLTRSSLYWTARVSLVRRQAELPMFDAVFAAVFDDAVLQMDPNARRKSLPPPAAADDHFASVPGNAPEDQAGAGLPWATLPPAVAEAEESSTSITFPERLPSEVAALVDVPFEQLNAREMALLGGWLQQVARGWPTRRSRRLRIDPCGHQVSIRSTIAAARRTGWEPIELVRVKALQRPRRVVMLCDVSQSMQAQAAAYFHLMRALALTVDAEVFAFATTLTRLTAVLAHRSPDVAMEQASSKVVDRFGGTRIATNIKDLLASHHGGAVRGAIVIVASDGWDSDTPAELALAMSRLRRRAYRVIWMNPRASAPGFEPRVATMAAALPYCDELLPADTFRSLYDVIAAISSSSLSSPSLSSPSLSSPSLSSPSLSSPSLSSPSLSSTALRGSRAGTARR